MEDKIKEELAKLEAQAVQALANLNFINGAKAALAAFLAHVQEEAKKAEAAAKVEVGAVESKLGQAVATVKALFTGEVAKTETEVKAEVAKVE